MSILVRQYCALWARQTIVPMCGRVIGILKSQIGRFGSPFRLRRLMFAASRCIHANQTKIVYSTTGSESGDIQCLLDKRAQGGPNSGQQIMGVRFFRHNVMNTKNKYNNRRCRVQAQSASANQDIHALSQIITLAHVQPLERQGLRMTQSSAKYPIVKTV